MLTNDEYHDILDAIKAAKADFGYVNISEDGTSFEVEAYQISPRSRFQNEEWPPWFNMQRRPDDVNAVYCDASIPDSLVLAMVGGEQVLSSGDWVVRFKNGDLSVLADSDFKKFSKVVPIPAESVRLAQHHDKRLQWRGTCSSGTRNLSGLLMTNVLFLRM